MNVEETLAAIAAAYPHQKRRHLAGPYCMDIPLQGPWRVASCSKTALFARGVPEVAGWKFLHDGSDAYDTLVRLFVDTSETPVLWQGCLLELSRFCGIAAWSEPCPACKGTSNTSDFVSCSFCNCKGQMEPDLRYGRLCGVPLNCNYLVRCLVPFRTDMRVQVYASPNPFGEKKGDLTPMLVVVAEEFRAVVMGMSPNTVDPGEVKKWAEAPLFGQEVSVGDRQTA